jgi:short-subunit dehydrogenase
VGKKAIVIGASSGIGRELVRQLAARGDQVAAVARRTEMLQSLANEYPGRVHCYTHDVSKTSEVPQLFEQIAKDLGGLDIVIYNAGVMPEVGPSEFSFDKDLQMINVNITGAVAWLNEAAHRFAQVKAGTIVGIGSVAGDRGRKGQPVYNMSKAALASYLESLRNRLHKFGVKVVTIKPGPTATEMTQHLHLKGMMDAKSVAAFTISKLEKPGEHYVKFTHRLIFAVIKRIPGPIFRHLPL